MACTTVPPMTFRKMEWSSKRLQHPDNTYRYRQRRSTESKQQDGSSALSAKPLLTAGSASFLVSKTAILQPRYKPQRRESCKTPQTTTPVEDFPYPDPLASAEGSSEFHKRIATLQRCVQDTCKWELYHKRIRSQETPAPSLLAASRGYRVHSAHRAVSHPDRSTSSTNVAEGTDRAQRRRPVLRRGASLPDLVLAADVSSTPTKSTLLPHPTGRRGLGSSADEQVHATTYTATQLSKSSSGCSERSVKAGLSADEKTAKKSSKPDPAVSDRMVQLSPNTVSNTAEKYVQPRPPAIPPPAAKQARKKRSYSRPASAKLVQKSKLAKTRPRTLSAK